MDNTDSSKIQFSERLFTHLGGRIWRAKPGFIDSRQASESAETGEVSEKQGRQLSPNDQFAEQTSQTPTTTAAPSLKVFVAQGIDAIWENESELSWQLWENIQQAFGWQEQDVQFFDADNLASEEAVMACVEEVIDLQVEQVFLMLDEAHSLYEILSEGVEVIQLPSLNEMLENPYAKQSFYQAMVPFSSVFKKRLCPC